MLENRTVRETVNTLPVPVLVVNQKTGLISSINDECELLYGYDRMTVVEMKINELIVDFGFNKYDHIRGKDVNVSYARPLEYRGRKKSGELFLVEIKLSELIVDGEPHLLLTLRDLSEEKNIKQELSTLKQHLSVISNLSKIGFWKYNFITKQIICSDEVYDIYECTRDEITIDKEFYKSSIHSEDEELFINERQKLFDNNSAVFEIIHRIILPNGKVKWIHLRGELKTNGEGALEFIEGVIQDVSEQKEDSHRLKLMESIITNTKDAVMITEAEPQDNDGPKIVYVNQAFTKMTGYKLSELIGETPRILQGPDTSREELNKLKKALSSWQPYETDLINYKKDGEPFWINLSLSPVSNDEGIYTHWIAIERDVTQQKKRELENSLFARISEVFRETDDFVDASQEICHTVSEFGDFDMVEMWSVNLDRSKIELISHSVDASKEEVFYGRTKDKCSFEISEGLPGKVWEKQSQLIWDASKMKTSFIRHQSAEKIGVNYVMGVPLITTGDVIGVLLMGTKDRLDKLNKYAEVLLEFENLIGTELNRKKLENEMRTIFHVIPDVFCVLDNEGKIMKINDGGTRVFGYTEEELLRKPISDLEIKQEDEQTTKDKFNESRVGHPVSFKGRYLTKDGRQIWLRWNGSRSIKDDYVYATAKDVTKEVKFLELSNLSSELALVGNWEVDYLNQGIYWSDTLHKLHETDPLNFVPDFNNTLSFYHPDFHDMVTEQFRNCIEKGEQIDYEAVIVTAKNKEKWVRAIGKSEFVNGQCIRVYGSFQDITSKKEFSLKILEANDRFEKATQATSDAIWDWDIVNDNLHWGDGYYKLFGYNKDERPKLYDWENNIHPEDLNEVKDDLGKRLEGNHEIWEKEYRYRKSDGDYAIVIDKGVIIRDKDGNPVRMIGAMNDITERKERELEILELNRSLEEYTTELERSNEALNSFAYITSHDLQEPLRTISSFMDLLRFKHGDNLDDKALEYIDFAANGAKRLKKMITDLLEYSRITKGSQNVDSVDLNEIISQYIDLRRKIISQKSAKILYTNLPTIPGHKVGIIQVLHSLLDNAIKYSRDYEDPIIKVQVSEKRSHWEFAIRDNGIGINTDYFNKIFNIFQRLNDQDEHSGSGIGLSIAKRQVELMGGEIWLDSKVNQGTNFYFTVPKNSKHNNESVSA